MEQNGDPTVELNREWPVLSQGDGCRFVPGTGARLAQRRLLVVLNIVSPKMFMFIGYFSWPISLISKDLGRLEEIRFSIIVVAFGK